MPHPGNASFRPRAFVDGNTLILQMTVIENLGHCASLIFYQVKRFGPGVDHVLIDCVAMDKEQMKGLTLFTGIDHLLKQRGVQLLFLDMSEKLKSEMTALMPNAIWIDSETGS